jgi:hypothetical protein
MGTRDELRLVLRELSERQPQPLPSSPGLDGEHNMLPPFRIELAAWAVESAAELHRQFGDDVELTVGQLPYPPGRPSSRPRSPRSPSDPPPLLDPGEVTVTLDGPAVVRSGHELRHGLLLLNHAGAELEVATNGGLTAGVLDPATGERVGGFAGWQTAPLIIFRAAPGETVRIPLLVGTTSSVPQLGYAIPPGDWLLEARVTLGPHPRESPVRRTPPLPLTIIGA